MKVPFFAPTVDEEDFDNVRQAMASGWLTTGQWTKKFEEAFSHYTDSKFCVAVNSATAALHLSVLASGIKAGDSVLVPTMTFASTAEILYYCGAKPILVDCNLKDLTIDLLDAERKLQTAQKMGANVVGIIPVHYAGKMVDMDKVEDFADRHHLGIIEDAAHCMNSQYFSKKYNQWQNKGKKSLTQCYSFYCNKCITTCGEGGMVCTDNEEIAHTVKSLSLHGLSKDAWNRFSTKGNSFYDISRTGYKYNLTDVAAAMGCSQLGKAELLKSKREKAVNLYKTLLENHPFIHWLDDEPEKFKSSHHLFVIRYEQPDASYPSRDQLLQALKENEITPSVHWKPLHLHSFYQKQGFKQEDFPNATCAFNEIISLPLFPDITKEQIVYVVKTLNKLLHVEKKL